MLLFSLSTIAQTVKIAVVNFQVKGGETLEGLSQKLNRFAEKAAAQKADYLLLPELPVFDLLSVNPSDKEIKSELNKLSSKTKDFEKSLKHMADKFDLNIVGASAVVKSGNHFLNRAYFIDPQGKLKYQDKVYPTPWEVTEGFKGGKSIELFKTPTMNFSILVCHDAEFPDISQSLMKTRPEVIFVPSMTDDEWGLNRVKFTSKARAVEHMAYVVMTGTSSADKAPWHTYEGRNHLFVPQNRYFKSIKTEPSSGKESLSFFTLDLKLLREARKDLKQVYPARDSSLKAY